MEYDYKKHKEVAHLLLGLIIVIFWGFVFDVFLAPKENLYEAIFISSVVTAAGTEYVQALLKLGSNTWQGVLKTSIPAIGFFIIKLLIDIFNG